ncbi:MAG: NAD-dependent epimerase/dehydratase family protein, partial [Terriglobales bacterium]
MKILVVGGAGYIGSITAHHLLQDGHDVVVFDNLLRGHRQAVSAGCTFIRGDMGVKADLEKTFSSHKF